MKNITIQTNQLSAASPFAGILSAFQMWNDRNIPVEVSRNRLRSEDLNGQFSQGKSEMQRLFSIHFLAGFILISVFFALADRARGEILVYDDFSYEDGNEIIGLWGGGGAWNSDWRWSSSLAIDPDNVDAAILGNQARESASFTSESTENTTELFIRDLGGGESSFRYLIRGFEKYFGDRIFVAFNLRVVEIPDDRSSFFLFLHESGAVIPTAYRLNLGVKDQMIQARYYHDIHNTIEGPMVSTELQYWIVGEFLKSIQGEDEYYDTIRFWVNPGKEDFFDPEGEFFSGTSVDIRCKGIDVVGFRMRGPNSGAYKIGNLVIATEWDDLFENVSDVQ